MINNNRLQPIAKRMRQIALATILLFAINSIAISQEAEQKTLFASAKEAENAGCIITKLKAEFPSSCIMKEVGEQMVTLVVYDGDKEGRFKRAEELCIPTYYWDADVNLLNLFKSANSTIEVKFTGAHGTGVGQKILMLIRWHQGKFVPILAETIDFHLDGMSEKEKMTVKYKYKNVGKDKPVVELSYAMQIIDIEHNKYKFNATWNDELTWNENRFSFYDEGDEAGKLKMTPCFIQNNLKRIRLKIRDINLQQRCDDAFDHYFYDATDLMAFDSERYYCEDQMKVKH